MLSAGIVGLPNVGKSTLFNAVTRTRKAPGGELSVLHDRSERRRRDCSRSATSKCLRKISHSKKIMPTAIEFVDIAGLVKGASAGEGLGNQFLHHIREVDAIVQVVRCFENPTFITSAGPLIQCATSRSSIPSSSLADLASLQKRRDRLQKQLHAR